jgi:hypothetical protein
VAPTNGPGSGHVGPTATAIEKIFAALFEGSSTAGPAAELDELWRRGLSGVTSEQVLNSGRRIVEKMALSVRRAITPDPMSLSDIRLELDGGEIFHVEIKARTTRPFNGLASADWVRNETDFLRYLFYNDANFRAKLPNWMRTKLTVHDPASHFGDWTCGDFWAADVALLKSRDRRGRAGVSNRAGLASFMSNKALIHVTKEGSQYFYLVDIAGVRDVLSGRSLHYILKSPPTSSVGVHVGGGADGDSYNFAYYVAYRTTYRNAHVVGRHKLQTRALPTGLMTTFPH